MNCPVQIPPTPKHVEMQVLNTPQHCRPLHGPLVHFPSELLQSEHIGERLIVHVCPASTDVPLILLGVPDRTLEFKGAALKGSTPRALPHNAEFNVQLSGKGMYISFPPVEGSTRKTCGGVPTLIANVDHPPSLPSQLPVGTSEKAGVLLDNTSKGRTPRGNKLTSSISPLPLLKSEIARNVDGDLKALSKISQCCQSNNFVSVCEYGCAIKQHLLCRRSNHTLVRRSFCPCRPCGRDAALHDCRIERFEKGPHEVEKRERGGKQGSHWCAPPCGNSRYWGARNCSKDRARPRGNEAFDEHSKARSPSPPISFHRGSPKSRSYHGF